MSLTSVLGMEISEVVTKLVILAVVTVLAAVVTHAITRVLRHALDASQVPSASIFINIARALVWAFALLAVLEPVFGVAPTAFVTALGVTSLVISLGLQDTISNLIGGLALMAGKVVQPGDVIEASGFFGKVVDVNWRSTVVRDRVGNEEIIPNSVLNKTSLKRYEALEGRTFTVDVTLAHNADIDAVMADINAAAQETLSGMLYEEMPPLVILTGAYEYGVRCTIKLRLADGIVPSTACDKLMRKLAGKPWLADACPEPAVA